MFGKTNLYSYFPEFIYEGIIQSVDVENHTCNIQPLSSRKDTLIKDVQIPSFAGSGNSGIWAGTISKGTRVVCMNTSGEGREFSVIVAILSKKNKDKKIFNNGVPVGTPAGSISNPIVEEGQILFRGEKGSAIDLDKLGNIAVTTGGNNTGIFLKRFKVDHVSAYSISQESSSFTNAGRKYDGVVRRIADTKRQFYPLKNLYDTPLFVDLNFHNVSSSIGFYSGSNPLKISTKYKIRNPELSENRTVINEFSNDAFFTGFDDEILRALGEKKLLEDSDTRSRAREPSNILQLAEHELIEVIGGNLIDRFGKPLNINYRSISYGDPGNLTPKSNIEEGTSSAKILSRRGIGYHFLLSTNVTSDAVSTNRNSFIFDIDKEGMLSVNLPKNSNTGNIPYPSQVSFDDGFGNISFEYENKSTKEPIPVNLRDKDGNPISPPLGAILYRETGIRFSNSDINPYFESDSGETSPGLIRVNTTRYHNMYAIAERLLANSIEEINMISANDFSALEINQPFEIFNPNPDPNETSDNPDEVNNADFKPPTSVSTITVSPDAPGIDPGGGTILCGQNFLDDEAYSPFSNSFKLEKNEETGEFDPKIVDPVFGDERKKTGGKSASINSEGSIELSVGKDNADEKSIVLDTAGSLLVWLGKDKNERSMILQTDGELLINVGGTYPSLEKDNISMNPGKFVLRVNVSDKGHLTTESDDSDKYNKDSDFLISIDENGLVIAGMKQNANMLIKNQGDLTVESGGTLRLKGVNVETIDSKQTASTDANTNRGSNTN